ncbi:hypothetical protein ONS96_008356 [Cadophora gregata f. sp. sojae]|nr:hypothetical protein ONS96_008356 [Cadophora gregata f. sp. sojae]
MNSTENHGVTPISQSEQLSIDEKYPIDEKCEKSSSSDEHVDVVVVEEGGDDIKESDYTPEEYKKLLKKIDRYLLPLMWVCYGIQQADKTSLGTQALFGIREDTNLVGQQYQWLTTIFYIAYLSGELPSNFLLQRWALGRTLSIYMLCWGICVICISAAQNWAHLMILRTLQGFFECTISPGFILVIGTWYRTVEHSSRSLFFQSANAGFGVIADLVMYGIGTHAERYGGIAAWRCISLFLGAATIVAALVCFVLLGSPKEVRWMSKGEKRMAAARIISNKAGRDVTGTKWNWDQVVEALKDPVLYFSTLNAFLSSVPNGGITTFGSLMYKSFGFTQLQVLLVGIPRSGMSIPSSLLYLFSTP